MAATYLLIVVAVWALTAVTTKPANLGYDWIPFSLLAMPWDWVNARLVLPGLIANTVLTYLLGTLLHAFWRRITEP